GDLRADWLEPASGRDRQTASSHGTESDDQPRLGVQVRTQFDRHNAFKLRHVDLRADPDHARVEFDQWWAAPLRKQRSVATWELYLDPGADLLLGKGCRRHLLPLLQTFTQFNGSLLELRRRQAAHFDAPDITRRTLIETRLAMERNLDGGDSQNRPDQK